MRKSLAPGHQTAARREASTRQWTRRRVGCSLFLVSVVCFSLLLHASQSVASLSSNLSAAPTAVRISLHDNWKIQNSELVSAGGQAVSTSPFDTQTWTPATVPSTVLANLAGPGLGQGGGNDPFAGMNWLKLPGSGAYYPLGKNYGEVETPPESPFGHAWWYRTQFLITQDQLLLFTDLHLKGVTYGAEIWLNGKKVADSDFTKGTYRQFRFDVTSKLKPGLNTLAILVSPPSPTDLTANWVDWNPTPQDKNMGLWREVFLSLHGPVELHRPFVASEIHLPQADQADLTLEVEATNSSPNAVTGLLHTHVMGHHLTEVITLQGHETKMLSLTAQKFPELRVKNPELWWPWQMGQPHLNHASMSFEINRTTSSTLGFEFGIRKIESVLMPNGTEHGSRLFLVNGKPIFIRGGGWASDLLLRFSESRERFEMAYAKSLGLNTIRLEGRFEPESFLSLADREGMLLMPGWVCCGSWQNDEHWTPDQSLIAQESLRDQLFELRSHASVAAFLYGSDEVPSPVIEKLYLDVVNETHWPNPALASASARVSTTGATGVKMTGPYSYTPPSYWYADKTRFGGAWGFNTETSPGVSMPRLESLKKFIPVDHWNAIDDVWNFHMGENEFKNLNVHRDAIERRYGPILNMEDFVQKSQVMDYDNHRAMFEAYALNKYRTSTGVVQWMLNSSWPSLLWHLYDFYLRPGAAFYGVKKANAPLHVQYSHDDNSVNLVNSTYTNHQGLTVKAQVVDINGKPLSSQSSRVDITADSAKPVLALTVPVNPDHSIYFVQLDLFDKTGLAIDHNFYWLSTTREEYDWDATDFKMTPLIREADLSGLKLMKPTKLKVTTTVNALGTYAETTVTNLGTTVAFFVHLRLLAGTEELLPVFWSDNDISLLPGETRRLTAHVPPQKKIEPLTVHGEGWNVSAW